MTLRRWTPLLPSLLGVLAVVAGLVVATSTSGHRAPGAYVGPVPLPTPHSIVREGHLYVVGRAPVMGASLHRDARLVTFWVTSTGPSESPPCDSLQPSVEVVDENATRVTVAAFSYRGPSRERVFGCTLRLTRCGDLPATGIPVHLAAPLGDRTIVDAHGGRVAVLAGQLLPRVGYVPAGYRNDDDEPDFSRDDRLSAPCVMHLQTSYTNGAHSYFDVSLSSASAEPVEGRASAIDVGGRRAELRISAYSRCVAWEPQPGLQLRVCTSARDPLPTPGLIKVARGLR